MGIPALLECCIMPVPILKLALPPILIAHAANDEKVALW
jgi:hypothetical protein